MTSPTTSASQIVSGSGDQIAEYSISENDGAGAITKKIQRVALVDGFGADVLGSPSDAANTATDGTAIGATAILKQLSASLQALVSNGITNSNTNTLQWVSGSAASNVNTSAAYAAGKSVGGVITFSNALSTNYTGLLQSVTLTFNDTLQTCGFWLGLFTQSSFSGTVTDNTLVDLAAADYAHFLGAWHTTWATSLFANAHHGTIYTLDGIGHTLSNVGNSSRNIYGVLVPDYQATQFASATEVAVNLGLIW